MLSTHRALTVDDLLAFCRKHPEVQELVKRAAHGVGPRGRPEKDGNASSKSTHGNGATYALKRLKRDFPQLAERVVVPWPIDGET